MKQTKEQETKEILERIANSLNQIQETVKAKKACQQQSEDTNNPPQTDTPTTEEPHHEHPENPEVPTNEEIPPVHPPVKGSGCKKLAVVVGINKYPTSPLNGCVNDAFGIGNILENQFDYDEVYYLTDDKATKENIVKGINWLKSKLRAGDAGVFFYAGHGTQVLDEPGGDERLSDKLDEAIVPIDAVFFNTRYNSWDVDRKKLIIDDQMKNLLKGLEAGVNFSVIFDSCNSGTAQRNGIQQVRGLLMSDHIKNMRKHRKFQADTRAFLQNSQSFVFLSATKADEYAIDTGQNGLYTEELLKQIKQGITYQQLHDATAPNVTKKAKVQYRQDQHPQIEGGHKDWKIFECPSYLF